MATLNIGIDLEIVARFKQLLKDDNQTFLKRVFTAEELKHCLAKKNPAPHLAARFCAKEAVIKALSSFDETPMAHNQIEIKNKKNGSPFVSLNDKKYESLKVLISLSHSKDMAIAIAQIQQS